MKMKINASEFSNVLGSATAYRDEGLFNLENDGILLRVHEYSNTALYATFIPDDAMEEYERGEFNKLGVNLEWLDDFVPSSNETITLEVEQDKSGLERLFIHTSNRTYSTSLIDPGQVSGVPEQIPDIEYPVTVTMDPDDLMDFISDAGKIRGDSDAGSFILSARDGLFYLHSSYDDSEVTDRLHWEDFEDYELNFDDAQPSDGSPHNPVEDHIIETFMSINLTNSMEHNTDTVRVQFGHMKPMKIVARSDENILHSYLVPPRIPTDDEKSTLPERVIRNRTITQ